MTDFVDTLAGYHAAQNGAIIVSRSHEGRVRAVGRDRLDLLHRMSTNDMNALPVGQAAVTVLTTPIARIVDRVWVLNRGETVLLITSPNQALNVRKWLVGHIFFRDDVKLHDVSTELGQFAIYGKTASVTADAVLAGSSALAANHFREQDDVIVLRGRPLAGDGFHILAPIARIESLWNQAVAAGALPASEATYELLRLAAGEPASGHELTSEVIPLEANLWDAVSFKKGCYIGQEIIARMESRGKLARKLLGIKLASAVSVGAEVRVGESVAGTVTSAGVLPEQGAVALSLLKTGLAEIGTPVRVGDVTGEVVGLPFG